MKPLIEGIVRSAASLIGAILLAAPAGSALAGEGMISSYVLVGDAGRPVVRAIIEHGSCPALRVDRRRIPMTLRAGPEALPLRPTASGPDQTKASVFGVSICEAMLNKGARHAALWGRKLPLPPAEIRRVVVIGDTGCRLKSGEKVQACSDPAAYPFAQIAAAAAAFKPDLVIHVGDYLYRETPCPRDAAGCQNSPWGYGWDAWNADFFAPGAPLLRVAPLALARGNHETCVRAGQGWWRLLDTSGLQKGRDCIDPANDTVGDYALPYAIPLGPQTQLIMFDSANTPNKALAPDDPRAVAYNRDYDAIAALASQTRHSLLVNHHPMLAFAAAHGKDGQPVLYPGNLGLQSVFSSRSPRLAPAGVDVLLSGHVHVFEELSFVGDFPTQFVTGFSGTQEDTVPLPLALPPSETPAPNATVSDFSSWVDGFGFMTMERTGPDHWAVQIRDVAGATVNTCAIEGSRSRCHRPQVTAAAK